MEHLLEKFKVHEKTLTSEERAHLKTLADGQAPKSMVLTCADSRICLNEVTDTGPGDIFVIRNAGNVIAPYQEGKSTNEGLTLNYAVEALNVSEVIVCGHVHCGAMAGLKDLPSLSGMPLLHQGLSELAADFDPKDLKTCSPLELTKLNIRMQMQNIVSYPFVQARIDNGTLEIWGWLYDFSKGTIDERVSLSDIL